MILVAGGTGRLGRLLVPALLGAGEQVRVLARHAATARGLNGAELLDGDVRERGSLAAAFEGVDTVISAVQAFVDPGGGTPETVDRDGNANLVEMAGRTGAAVILLSVTGAGPSSPMEYCRMKWAAEEILRHSSVEWTIVRASAFAETWVEVLTATAGSSQRPMAFGRGDNPINFVMVVDVAAAVLRALGDDAMRGHVIEVGGPENVSLTEFARRVQETRGRTESPRHVPRLVLRAGGWALRSIQPGLARQMRTAVSMDTMDLRFDSAAARAKYPWLPCSPLWLDRVPISFLSHL